MGHSSCTGGRNFCRVKIIFCILYTLSSVSFVKDHTSAWLSSCAVYYVVIVGVAGRYLQYIYLEGVLPEPKSANIAPGHD